MMSQAQDISSLKKSKQNTENTSRNQEEEEELSRKRFKPQIK